MKLILVGKAASGKDHLKSRLREKGFKCGVSHTTRPPRSGEVDGIDYHFVDDATFQQMIQQDLFVEYMAFNGCYYGQTKVDFAQADVMIMSKDGLDMLPKLYREGCVVIYLDVDQATRLTRLNQRADVNDTILRRIQADEAQFSDFTDFDIRITNPNF